MHTLTINLHIFQALLHIPEVIHQLLRRNPRHAIRMGQVRRSAGSGGGEPLAEAATVKRKLSPTSADNRGGTDMSEADGVSTGWSSTAGSEVDKGDDEASMTHRELRSLSDTLTGLAAIIWLRHRGPAVYTPEDELKVCIPPDTR